MNAPILTTKLNIPSLRRNFLTRTRLLHELDEGLRPNCRLILITGPAGFGKTSIISEWLSTLIQKEIYPEMRNAHIGWITLDERDNDFGRFFCYFISAFQKIFPGNSFVSSTLLNSPANSGDSFFFENFLTSLLNDLASLPHPALMVLDDYHVVASQKINDAITFLINNLPSLIRIIVVSRTDPPFPLSRLRARDQLTELHTNDLRFSNEETEVYLNQNMGLRLPPESIQTLQTRIEGWIAGLQLAAISLQNQNDIDAFISAFSGSNRYIIDYLIDEVLKQLPEDIQDFLLKTSILNRMTGALCDVVTGKPGSQDMLERLENDNIFIIPLDNNRIWYRYHNLFAEFLRSHLQRNLLKITSSPEKVENFISGLHKTASDWFDQNNYHGEAIDHAIQAKEFVKASTIIEKIAIQNLLAGDTQTLLRWLRSLPDAIISTNPRLCLAHAWVLFSSGHLDEVEEKLIFAEKCLDICMSELYGEINAVRTMMAALSGDLDMAKFHGHKALDQLPSYNLFTRGMIAMTIGIVHELCGDMKEASQAYKESNQISQLSENLFSILMTTTQIADLNVQTAHLYEAEALYQRALKISDRSGNELPIMAMVHVNYGSLLYEWNRLEEAETHFLKCFSLNKYWESQDMVAVCNVHMAGLSLTRGNHQLFSMFVERALQASKGHMASPQTVDGIRAQIARLHLRAKNCEEAENWADFCIKRGPSNTYLTWEIETLTLARLLIAKNKTDKAIDILLPLLDKVMNNGRIRSVIETRLLIAIIHEAEGNQDLANFYMQEAIKMSVAQGFFRLFADEGEYAKRVMSRLYKQGFHQQYIHPILNTFNNHHAEELTHKKTPHKILINGEEIYIESFSDREVEVLKLISEGFSNQEIATRLVVAVSTVKTHINNIYAKMGVDNRVQAVTMARQLDLL